jgi:hypothetical protein
VFVDRGAQDGVKVGNQMLVVRRGDAYQTARGGDVLPAGMDDRRFPDSYIGSVLIVDAGKKNALGMMTRTEKEVLIGDHVLMRRPK